MGRFHGHKRHLFLQQPDGRGGWLPVIDAMVTEKKYNEAMAYVGGKIELSDDDVKRIKEIAGL